MLSMKFKKADKVDNRFILPKSPGVYAVIYEGNIVKFGRARNLMQRCSTHQKMLREVVCILYFEDSDYAQDREVLLLSLANARFNLEIGREYFKFGNVEMVKSVFNEACSMVFIDDTDKIYEHKIPFICPIDVYDLALCKILNRQTGISENLSLTTRILLCYIMWVVERKGNEVLLSNVTIARNLGVERKTINRELKKFVNLSILKKSGTTPDGCWYRVDAYKNSSIYELYFTDNIVRTGADSDTVGGFGVFNKHKYADLDDLCAQAVI